MIPSGTTKRERACARGSRASLFSQSVRAMFMPGSLSRGCFNLAAVDQAAVVKEEYAVHLSREFEIVGRDEAGNAFAPHDLDQRIEHACSGFGVEIAGRFVCEQKLRLVGERARNGDALLFAARQLRRTMIEPRTKTHDVEKA